MEWAANRSGSLLGRRLVRIMAVRMSTGIRRLSMAAVMAVALATSATRGLQDQADAARARIEIGAQLEELGTTLKAAAMSGTLTDKEA